jgi:hypothetical protein
MIRRTGLSLLLAIAPAFAQLSLYTVQGTVETPVGQAVDFGSVSAGDAADLLFRVKNSGSKLTYLTFLSVSGTDFSIPKHPLLPAGVDAGGNLDFTVHFQPGLTGSYSATLQVNEISTILLGKGVPGLTVFLNKQPLSSGQTIGFGEVQAGSTQTLALTLENGTTASLIVPATAIQGSGFKVAGTAPAGATVAPGASVELDVVFAPASAGPQQALLVIGGSSYPLQGTAAAPPPPELPKPSIQLDLPQVASASQGKLSINLAEAAKASATGTVTLQFQSAVAGVSDDPSVTFADGTRSAAFSVAEGASAGQFGTDSSIQFATGTTAGSLLFTVELGSNTAQTSLTVPAAAIGIDAAVAVRNVSCLPADLYCTAVNVELEVNGWDNSRTASQILFRFFDPSGNAIAPGDISVDGTQAFQQYFQTSSLGGVFGLHARFPINGDANRVTAAEVSLTNSAGSSKTARIQF